MPVASLPAARSTGRTKAGFALAAAIALAAVACVGGGGTRPGRETPADLSFLDPLAEGQEAQDLFEVEADDAEYWRLFTLDAYDGMSWTSTNMDGSEGGAALPVPATLPWSGEGPPPDSETLHQTFRILGDLGFVNALPMAQTAEEIAGPIGDIAWDPARSQAFIDRDLETGATYTVRSRIAVPTPEELDQVGHLSRIDEAVARSLALPDDLDPRIEEIAKRWTAGATSDYRKVLAIQERFQEEDFVYSNDVDTDQLDNYVHSQQT